MLKYNVEEHEDYNLASPVIPIPLAIDPPKPGQVTFVLIYV